jgi:hypothetical protein
MFKKSISKYIYMIPILLISFLFSSCAKKPDEPRYKNPLDPQYSGVEAPKAPQNLQIKETNKGVLLTWSYPESPIPNHIKWCYVYRKTLVVKQFFIIAKLNSVVTRYEDKELEFGKNDYIVSYVNNTGLEGYRSNIVSFKNTKVSGVIKLPQTGQNTSYSSGDDGALQKGVSWPSPRFTDNGDGTVTDNLTGLMWAQDANMAGAKTWSNAISYCNDLTHAGYSDWRLPNRKELRSLLDYSKYGPVLPQGHPFTNVQSYYWSSTTEASYTDCAWYVGMYDGHVYRDYKSHNYYVWPVRFGDGGIIELPQTGQKSSYLGGDDGDLQEGVSWPLPRFVDLGDGTIADKLTGLIWTKDANLAGSKTWQEALDYVAGMNSGTKKNFGYTDWRLPNINELESLIDAEQYGPALPQGHPFTNVQSYYWSSTTNASSPNYAWGVVMHGGDVYWFDWFDKSNNYYVWPVRSRE